MLMLFKKGKLPTQGYLVFGLPVRGGHAIYFSKNKEDEKVFLLNNLLTVIQWVYISCICFLKGKQPYTRFFDNNGFPIRGGHNMRHCKPVHQSQSQNCAIFTANIWSM